MADTIAQQILRQSLDLSYAEIETAHPSWPKKAIDDYFYKQSNIYSLAANSQASDNQVANNTAAILVNADNIVVNADNLTNHINNESGAHASSAISYNNTVSGLLAIEIQAAIDEVDGLVEANATNITNVNNAFNTHNGSSSQHGVTGDNVGTGDYCTAIMGGVVDLSAAVTNAVASTVSVTSPDATDLPTALTLANETKVDVNQLVTDLNAAITQLNEFLANNKTAKQMAS
tara:strand:+ start:801 stop:1496 length:696 start_codon:yes stop_codon:yes gene_type:complete